MGIRECAYLGVPVVNIGSRQMDRERGLNVIDVEYDQDQLIKAIRQHIEHGRYDSSGIYGDGLSGEKAAEIIVKADIKTHKRLTY